MLSQKTSLTPLRSTATVGKTPFSLAKAAPRPAAMCCALVPALANAAYAKELEAACEAVRLASKLCQKVQQGLSDSEKQDKSDESPVTVADYGAQALVAWSLSRSTCAPGERLSMVAEEDSASLTAPEGRDMLDRITRVVNDALASAAPGASAPLTPDDVVALIDLGASQGGPTGRHWVLDPIDGTRGFVGKRQYAVCLGMLQDGELALGVLGCPNLPTAAPAGDADGGPLAAARGATAGFGALFLAHAGAGAYAAPLWGVDGGDAAAAAPPLRIQVSDSPLGDFSAARFMESYESRHSNHGFSAQVAQALGVAAPPLRLDSQAKYGLLSRGDASIFMRFPPAGYREKIWDHAAGVLIVHEAGGRVTDAGGAPLDFSKGRYLALDRGIVAAPPAVHAAILRAVAELGAVPAA